MTDTRPHHVYVITGADGRSYVGKTVDPVSRWPERAAEISAIRSAAARAGWAKRNEAVA